MKKDERVIADILVTKAIDKLKLTNSELERRLAMLEKEAQLLTENFKHDR